MQVEVEQEADGRWIAEVPSLPGAMAYGASRKEAIAMINGVLREEINAEDVIKDELERRGRLIKDLAKILEHVRHTRVGSDISAKSIAEFKLTSTVNEDIVIKINELIGHIERIEKQLRRQHNSLRRLRFCNIAPPERRASRVMFF